jgi:hypothetical protein
LKPNSGNRLGIENLENIRLEGRIFGMTVDYVCERTVEYWQDVTVYGKYGRHLSRTVEYWTDCQDILRRIVEYWTEPYTIGQERPNIRQDGYRIFNQLDGRIFWSRMAEYRAR